MRKHVIGRWKIIKAKREKIKGDRAWVKLIKFKSYKFNQIKIAKLESVTHRHTNYNYF